MGFFGKNDKENKEVDSRYIDTPIGPSRLRVYLYGGNLEITHPNGKKQYVPIEKERLLEMGVLSQQNLNYMSHGALFFATKIYVQTHIEKEYYEIEDNMDVVEGLTVEYTTTPEIYEGEVYPMYMNVDINSGKRTLKLFKCKQ